MKLTVNTKSLTEAIDWVLKLYGRGNSEGTSYVGLVVTPKGEAHLYHPNALSYMKAPLIVTSSDLEDTPEGTVLALEGRYLKGLIAALNSNKKEDTELSTKETPEKQQALAVKTSNGSFSVPTVTEKPAQEPKLHHLGEVNDQEFLGSLQRLSKLCDSVHMGLIPALGSVDVAFNLEEKRLVLMATDRYAIGEATIPFLPLVDEAPADFPLDHLLIPMEVTTSVSPSKEGTETITLVYEKKGKKFGYLFPNGRVALCSLKDATPLVAYLKAKEQMKATNKNSVIVNRSELRKAISTVSSIAWEEKDLLFTITSEGVTISDKNKKTLLFVASTEEENEFEGEQEVVFITSIINEGLAPLTSSRVGLRWGGDAPQAFMLDSILDDDTVDDSMFMLVGTVRTTN